MNDLLARNRRDDKSVEVRRLIVLVAVVIVLSGAWHGLRGTLVRAFGTSSIGCYGRDALIRGALRQAGFDIDDDAWLISHSLPRPGWVMWGTAMEAGTLPNGSQYPTHWQNTVVDGRLRLLGWLSTRFAPPWYQTGLPCGNNALLGWLSTGFIPPPMDLDGDGRWEVRVTMLASESRPDAGLMYRAVLRLGADANEIIWLGLVDDSVWDARNTRAFHTWQDTDGDGVQELVFMTLVYTLSSSGSIVSQATEIVASFKLDRPGGMLWPETMSADCGITPWDPPDGAPVRVEQDADLQVLFRELLPLPEPSP